VVVNDLEKHIPEAAKLLDFFDQFPRWRVADVQASLSGEAGGVGAHSDQFDVFLMQGEGRKRWSISDDPIYAPEKEESFFQNIDVRVLKDFQPKARSLLEPGDVLYLPPKVAHYGVAESCDAVCVTYSIGFLAPTHDDLILSYAQSAVDTRNAVTERWSDPWLEPQDKSGQISQAAVKRAGDIIRDAMPKTETDIARWFGCHVTGSSGFDGEQAMPEEKLSLEELQDVWAEEGALIRRADVKFAFIDEVADGSLEGCLLFAGGEVWELTSPSSIQLARYVANNHEIMAVDWQGLSDESGHEIDSEGVALVHDLFSNGFLFLNSD
jgi:ribosomal protein L16 Arg81 hydroxylase